MEVSQVEASKVLSIIDIIIFLCETENLDITRKEEILFHAAALFRKKGYAATTMRDIAREVGVEAASLYNHISSKQLILKELLLEIAKLFTQGMEAIKSRDLTNLKRLEALISLHVDITVSHTDAISLLPNEWVHLEEPSLKSFLKLRDAYEKEFKNTLEAAIEKGQLKKLDADIAMFSILSTLRWLYSWYSKYKDKDSDVLKQELIQALLYGI